MRRLTNVECYESRANVTQDCFIRCAHFASLSLAPMTPAPTVNLNFLISSCLLKFLLASGCRRYSLAHRGALPRRSAMIDDQARSPLARQKGPNPLQEDAQTEAGCGQELEVDESPNHPREQSAHLDLPTLQYGKALAHYSHGALIEVAKWSRVFAASYAAVNEFSR